MELRIFLRHSNFASLQKMEDGCRLEPLPSIGYFFEGSDGLTDELIGIAFRE